MPTKAKTTAKPTTKQKPATKAAAKPVSATKRALAKKPTAATKLKPPQKPKPSTKKTWRQSIAGRVDKYQASLNQWEAEIFEKALEREQKRGGRPTGYHPELCPFVIALGRMGRNKTEMAFEIGISRRTLYNWANDYPEFYEALERAHEAAECYFMERGRAGMHMGNGFNGGVWQFMAQNTVPESFRNKKELDVTAKGPTVINMIITPEEAAL